jgi:hypothetical protein
MKTENLDHFEFLENCKFLKEIRALIQAEGKVNFSFRPSVFFDSNATNWSLVNSYFYFPLEYDTIESAFLSAINSERNINTRYRDVRNIKIVKAFYVNEKGFAKEEIKI